SHDLRLVTDTSTSHLHVVFFRLGWQEVGEDEKISRQHEGAKKHGPPQGTEQKAVWEQEKLETK
ncbi:sn1-specific diacylglycerol lipase alpha-like X2, partial [Biomphalaria glabrata]